MARGKLIVFEGGDGVGKTTQAVLLLENLRKMGTKCEYFKYPDRSTESGAIINRYLRGETEFDCHAINLVLVSNLWELSGKIEPLINGGTTVIMDRYRDSHTAYAMARGCSREEALKPCEGLSEPDLVIFFDLDPREAMKRKTGPLEVLEKVDFQERVYANYQTIIGDSWVKINASLSPEQVSRDVMDAVLRK